MSVVTIDYDKLSKISKSASNAASEMNDYIDALTKKVTKKYSDITGGASSKTSSSEYYVNHKISKLKEKKEYYSNFSEAVTKFSKNAKEADKQVAKQIKSSTYDFVEKHDYIDVNWWTELKEFFIDLKNACPLFEAISAIIGATIDEFKNLFEFLKHLYKCGGGKEIIGVVLAVAGAVAAVVIAIAALVPPISGLVAICAAIGAVIAACNAIVNVITSHQAWKAKKKGDPGWAKVYSGRDSMQDCLRDVRWTGSVSFLNKAGPWIALGLDVTELFCTIVALGDGISKATNTFKEMKKYANQSKTRNFGQIFKDYLFNKETYASTKDKPVKMRELLQERGKIRTLRGYKNTKAMSIAQYDASVEKYLKSLKGWQRLAKTAVKSKYITIPQNLSKYGGKLLDFTFGGKGSYGEGLKNFTSDMSGKYLTPGLLNDGYGIYRNKDTLAKDFLRIYNNNQWASYKTGVKAARQYNRPASFDFTKAGFKDFRNNRQGTNGFGNFALGGSAMGGR